MTGIVRTESMVVPSVKATAPSVSPSNWSENVDASPAVGTAKAINTPIIKSESTKPFANTDFTISKIPTIVTGKTTNFNKDT